MHGTQNISFNREVNKWTWEKEREKLWNGIEWWKVEDDEFCTIYLPRWIKVLCQCWHEWEMRRKLNSIRTFPLFLRHSPVSESFWKLFPSHARYENSDMMRYHQSHFFLRPKLPFHTVSRLFLFYFWYIPHSHAHVWYDDK